MLRLMKDAARHRKIPRHGGVRVFEEGDETHRAHAHWVMSPRMGQSTVQRYATLAGLGHVWLDFRPAGGPLAGYLCKYLSKGRPSMQGLKQWACFGEFSGVKVKDVEIESEDVRRFREHRKVGLAQGMSTTQAFTYASLRVNMAKYGVFADTEQASPPQASAAVMPNEKTEVTAVVNVLDNPSQVCIVKGDANHWPSVGSNQTGSAAT